MIVYMVMFVFAEFFAYQAYNLSKQKSKSEVFLINFDKSFTVKDVYFFLSAIPFFLVTALRYNVGTDYITYSLRQIPNVIKGIRLDQVEFLYRYVIRLGMAIGGKQWVFVLTGLLFLLFIWLSVGKYSLDIRWSIFIFTFGAFFNTSLNLMRQFVAMAIALYALRYAYEKKKLPFFVWILIAFLFHKTAIVFVLFYLLADIELPIWAPLTISAILACLTKLMRNILEIVANISVVYSHYIDNVKYDRGTTQWDFIFFEIGILLIILYCKWRDDNIQVCNHSNGTLKFDAVKRQENIYCWMQTITAVVAILSSIFPNSTRIIMLFAIAQIVSIPTYLEKIKEKNAYYFISLLLIVLYILLFARIILIRGVGETLPYNFIFVH
ncbi:MAG: EpsG family protein [Eubacteriales bacterium]|nr:EpsG family protein [Eubacteriales bacterium]